MTRSARLLSALVLLAVLPAALVAYNLHARSAAQQRTAELSEAARKGESAIAAAAVRGADMPQPAQDFLAGTTVPIAGAELQRLASRIITRAGASVESFEMIADEAAQAKGEVRVGLTFGADIERLQVILFEMERTTPALTVASIDIARGGEEDDPTEATPLDVAMVVTGQWRPEP